MIQKVLLLLYLSTYTLFALHDFGTVASVYPVQEPDMIEVMKTAANEVNITELQQTYSDMINAKFTVKSDLPMSVQNEHYINENYIILDYDFRLSATGPIIHKAGEKIYPRVPAGETQTICFIDAYKKIVVEPMIKALGDCDIYMIANRDIREFYETKLFENKEIYPYNNQYEERFKIKVLPTKVKIYGKYFEYTIIDMNPILEKLRVKGDIL